MRHNRSKGAGGGSLGVSLACLVLVVILLWVGAVDRLKCSGLQAKLDAATAESGRERAVQAARRTGAVGLRSSLPSLHRAESDTAAELARLEVESGRAQVSLGARRTSIGKLRSALRSLRRADKDAAAELARLESDVESVGESRGGHQLASDNGSRGAQARSVQLGAFLPNGGAAQG